MNTKIPNKRILSQQQQGEKASLLTLGIFLQFFWIWIFGFWKFGFFFFQSFWRGILHISFVVQITICSSRVGRGRGAVANLSQTLEMNEELRFGINFNQISFASCPDLQNPAGVREKEKCDQILLSLSATLRSGWGMPSPVQDFLGLPKVEQKVNPVIVSGHDFWRRVMFVHSSHLGPKFGGKKEK